MIVYAYTNYLETCEKCMLLYVFLFDEKPETWGSDSTVQLDYATDELKALWKSWLKAAKKVGLVYDWEIK